MPEPSAAASLTSPITESRSRRPTEVPPVGWVPRPLEDAAPGFMGLAFMGAGLLVWLLFWFGDAEPPQGLRKWGSAAFAALFFIAGIFLARLGFRAPRWWADRRFRGGREPWGQGYQWSRTVRPLTQSHGLDPCARAVGLLMLAVLLVVINLVWFDLDSVKGSVAAAYLVIPLISVVIVAVAGVGFWGVVVSLRRGPGTLRLDAGSYPAAPGGVFRAEYVRGARQPAMLGAFATLYCVEIELGPGTHSPAASALYGQTREVEATADPDGGAPMRVEFLLPADVLPTDLERERGRRFWLLQIADRDAAGTPAAAPETFLVPVYCAASLGAASGQKRRV